MMPWSCFTFAKLEQLPRGARLLDAVPPGTCPRLQIVITMHDLNGRAQAGFGRSHPHLARLFAVGRGQAYPFVSPQARAVLQFEGTPSRGIDLAAAPAALDHERGRC